MAVSLILFSCGEASTNPAASHVHEYVESIEEQPTCETDGQMLHTCSCGLSYKTPISHFGHNYSVTGKDATCTSTGTKTYTCSRCGKSYTETIKAIGHNYSGTVTKNVTCTQDGTKTFKCSNCGDTYTEIIKATGHSYDSNGKCTKCGAVRSVDMKKLVGAPTDWSDISVGRYDVVHLSWWAKNNSGKTIKYYTVELWYYNRVGDGAFSSITRTQSQSLRFIGPVAPGEELSINDDVDRVPGCYKVTIAKIKLEYTDGTSDSGLYAYSFTDSSY